ncbi:MAG: hypothetical protein KGI67_13835 [Pseudomonadota bacterium]|nr:hypothetical protein [Pseudomonadota bacterium]
MMAISTRCLLVAIALAGPFGAQAATPPAPVTPPAVGQLIERNVAARGGLDAWRRIRTMAWSGRLEAASAEPASMRFVLEQARPNRTRFAIEAMGQPGVRVFDGAHGWTQRPSRGIRPDVVPFTPQELRFAQDAEVIDGPLIDFAAHGSRVTLGGLEDVHGRQAWRIDVTRPSGTREAVWIDAETFLDVRYDRVSYRPAGGAVTVSLYYQDYRSYEGVKVPAVIDIGGNGDTPAGRMVIEQVVLNPQLDERAFAEPGTLRRRQAADPGSHPPSVVAQ